MKSELLLLLAKTLTAELAKTELETALQLPFSPVQ